MDIKVSICSMVYNQAQYVEDMLRGIFMQKVDFDFEVIIHDDASTDGTIEILKKYKERYPDNIILLLEEENQYSKGVRITKSILYPCVKGKYMVLVEGDDYWIYEGKLQAQYDLMETHPEVSLCYHNALVYDEGRDEVNLCINNQKTGYISDCDIICTTHGWYPTASLFCRAAYLLEQPDMRPSTGDEGIRTYMACRGKLYFINQVWSVYRQYLDGSFNARYCENIKVAKTYNRKLLSYFNSFNVYSERRFEEYLYERIKRSLRWYIEVHKNTVCTMEQFHSYIEELKEDTEHIADGLLDEFRRVDSIRCTDYYQVTVETKVMDRLSSLSGLYVYGAGREALKAIIVLLRHKVAIAGMIVTQKSKNQEQLLGYPVYGLDEVRFDENMLVWPCLIEQRRDVISLLKERNVNILL